MTAPLVVVGDVMLDIDLIAESARLSPEAPVPVLHDPVEHRRPGGAALAALLAAAGPRPVVLVAPLATDEAGRQLRRMLAGRLELVALPWGGSTPVKTRLRVAEHPVARLDRGGDRGLIGPLPERVRAVLASAAAVLVSDYGRGVTADAEVRAALTGLSCPLVWDPHPRGAAPVPGSTLVTPNLAELAGFVAMDACGSLAAIRRGAQQLARQWQAGSVCVTLGSRGAMFCLADNAPHLVAAAQVAAGDTCGAGDCFAAAAAAGLADGVLPSEAVALGVAAAGRFVAAGAAAGLRLDPSGAGVPPAAEHEAAETETTGAGVPPAAETEAAETAAPQPQAAEPEAAAAGPSRPEAAADPNELDRLLDGVRSRHGVVVATGGCFDLLHAGHIATLQAARAAGDCLVVCLNSDASVRRLKGAQRPLQPAADRARVLAALECVDAVVVFEEDTPAAVLRRIRPDIWAKGGDYSGVPLPESAVLAEWGGEAVTVPYLRGRSTSALVELARQAELTGGSAL
ncbi:MAG TPA: PfkB family carbohydrate kinase [Jatrophihabitans sp.]|jgi:rfaE bifunctional protein nucleotidyltransferase chain/domain/rfaE bifunctional protein kinase chain/domain|uniref:PfkB family carbohydrate kinase n=1 Tax=Jatrophihabitans sp. TaxID=1932789 RepID=UPI002F1E06F3